MATSISFEILAKDHASSTFLKVAAAAEACKASFGDAGGAALGLAKAFGATGLIPVAAGASAALIELSTSAAAGGLALGVFGASAVGILAGMKTAETQIKATDLALSKLTPGTAAYKAEVVKLKGQQVAFNTSFGPAAKGYNDMTNSFTKFKDATGKGATLGVLHQGFELIAQVLPKLVPVSNAAGKAVGSLLHDLSNWTKSPSFTAVLHWLEKSGPKAIKAFGHSVGNIIVGLGGILKNFVGPGNKAAHTMEMLTARFAKWGNSKGVSDSVDKFLKYVSANGGKITSVLASLAQTVPKLVIALGGLGATNLSAVGMFLNLVAGLPQGVFNVLAKALFAMYVSTKLWTIATAAANAVAAIALIRLKMLTVGTVENTIATKIGAAATKAWAVAQLLFNAALDANPIVLVVIGLIALGVALVVAYKKSDTFRKIVSAAFHGVLAAASAVADFFIHRVPPAFNKVVSVASGVLSWVRGHWPLLLAILAGPFGLAVLEIAKNWDKIRSGVTTVISDVTGFFHALPGKILHALGSLGKLLWNAGVQIMEGLLGGIDSKLGALHDKMAAIAAATKAAFTLPLKIFSPSKVFRGYGQNLMDGLLQGIADKQMSVQAAMSKVAAVISTIGTQISNALSKISNLQGIQQGFKQTFGATSIFSTDQSSGTVGIGSLVKDQKAQAMAARRLLRDVRRVTKMGLSKNLIRQLQSEGTAGAATLHQIALGDPSQIKQLNRLNAQTNASLQAAGLRAGNYVRGGSINADIRLAQKQEHTLEMQMHVLKDLEHHLRELAHSEKKGQTIEVQIDSEAVIKAIIRRNKRKGVKTAGV